MFVKTTTGRIVIDDARMTQLEPGEKVERPATDEEVKASVPTSRPPREGYDPKRHGR